MERHDDAHDIRKNDSFLLFFFYGDAGHDTLAYAYNACSMYSWILCLYHEHYNDDLCLAFAD